MSKLQSVCAAVFAAAAFVSGAAAQDVSDEDIAALRAELAAAQAIQASLTARIEAIERARGSASEAARLDPLASSMQTGAVSLPSNYASALDTSALSNRTAPFGPPERALSGTEGFAAELSAGADATSVSIRLSSTDSRAGLTTGVYTTRSVTASAPLSSGARFTDLGTLDGFSNAASLRLQFSRYIRPFSEPDLQPGYAALMARVTAACLRRLGSASKDCDPDIPGNTFVRENAPELEGDYLALFRMRPGSSQVDWSARAYGVEGSVGYKRFEYLLAGPARRDDAERVPVGARVFYSWLPDVRRESVTGSIEYQRTFKEASAGGLCPAAQPASETTCLTGPIGEPERDDNLLVSVEYRRRWVFDERAFIPSLGLSAMLTYDAIDDQIGIDLPIYLANDPKGGLTGGIRLGYREEDSEFVAGVFVGTAFSLR